MLLASASLAATNSIVAGVDCLLCFVSHSVCKRSRNLHHETTVLLWTNCVAVFTVCVRGTIKIHCIYNVHAQLWNSRGGQGRCGDNGGPHAEHVGYGRDALTFCWPPRSLFIVQTAHQKRSSQYNLLFWFSFYFLLPGCRQLQN